jgi:pheromone shutdown protein TraB
MTGKRLYRLSSMSPPIDRLLADDPRLDADHVRVVDGAHDVTVVGVVHDHPASVYRVRELVDAVAPDVVALELPSLALPLYQAYVDNPDQPTERGGEMSAAIDAADEADIVAIDAPSRRFVRALGRIARSESILREEVERVVRGLDTVTRRAVACRLAAPLVRRTDVDLDLDAQTDHGCTTADAPTVQAEDERRQIRRSVALLGALDGGGAAELRDRARESAMADALAQHRDQGSVVAVVGHDHLDPVADRLSDA